MATTVHAANIHDSITAINILSLLRGMFPRCKVIFADKGYRGERIEKIKLRCNWIVQIVLRNDQPFEVLAKRWIAERAFAWLGNFRRLSKDDEYLPEASEAMIQLSMIKLMINKV